MDFDERQLRAIVAIAETGSLGRAARVVNMTQPSLSRQIQAMEQRLGHRLFERGGKGMALTEAGRLMLPHARHLISEMQNTRDELAALGGLRRGTVRVGAVAAVLRTLVAETVGRVLAETPLLTIDMVEAVDGELLEALLTRRIDLAIPSRVFSHRDVCTVGTCDYSDTFAVFCAADHPLPPSATLRQTLHYGWVMPSPAFTPRTLFEEIVEQSGMPPPRIVAESSSVEAMISVAARSELLCWLPEPLLKAHTANGSMRKLAVPELSMNRHFSLHKRRAGILPEAALQFVRHFPLLRDTYA
ncbi:LysR family transcriptional regulator [Novosphingobium taihuense]|uniref:Molybdate transport repressor ModE-like protein n=1 Tax=Novosphingobium taihuense TaxID=260085 RepID=A0A7W7AAW1_9SPHN|nr:LysR family transcriptional regulator [Novosphingobium taihuense]MBB4613541.1 molybdate transport repressor ModE-like protein [Novosphingobium taihuense]TWH81215.1 transcriptional regulator, LysR family [Novosphingobium taihuense]